MCRHPPGLLQRFVAVPLMIPQPNPTRGSAAMESSLARRPGAQSAAVVVADELTQCVRRIR